MELEKTKSETKRKKSKPLRKNAIAMTEPLDMSGLHLTVEESTKKKTTIKRTKSDCGLKPEYVETTERGAIPKKGSHTEKLHRKFKVISSKSDIETDDGSPGLGKETTYQRQRTVTRTMPEATPLPKGSDETVVEIEIHKTVNRIDKDVQLYEDIDVRIQDNVKVRRDMTSIKSNSDVVMNELMADVYKKTNMEKLSFLDPFDSSLNIFDDEIHRSNSFNVTSDLRHHKDIEHSSIPRLGRAYSNASAMTIEDDRFEEIISTKEIIVKRRIHPQSEKLSRKSRCDQLEVEADFHSEIPQNRMRRKSKSEELVQGSHEKFLQALQLGSNRDDCSDEGNFSSSEDLLNTPQWHDRKWKSKELLFSQSSMNSIEENFETPPSTPSFNTTKEGGLFFDKKSKTDQKRKISTGKKIIDKIKNEIVRKISCGEKNPSKMKREKSFERLRKHICEVDKNFQKWIDHVRRIHVSTVLHRFI